MLLFLKVASSDLMNPNEPAGSAAQPWAVSIAAELTTMDGITRGMMLAPIRSDGRPIKAAATAKHGITARDAARAGVSEIAALGFLIQLAMNPTHLIAWNVDFDRDVLVSVLAKLGKDSRMLVRSGLELIGVQDFAKAACKLPGGDDGQFRRPTLDEAIFALMGEKRPDAPHSAWNDLTAMRAIFFVLRDRGLIQLEGIAA